MKVKGMGGWWVIPTGGSHNLALHNAIYEVLTEVDVRETRSIGCGGWSEGLPRFRRVEHAFFKVAEDDVSYPQVLGFTEGEEVTVYLKRGALGEYDKLTRAIVKSVVVTNDQKKARWVEVVCQHGVYARGVAPPGPLVGQDEEEDG